MKLFFVTLILLFLASPFFAYAHGGVEKTVGNVTVFLNQSPLSPLVGEPVTFNFILARASDPLQRLTHFSATITLIDTAPNDPMHDLIRDTKLITTDVNGAFHITYPFNKENFFDLELTFRDPISKEIETTGFLVEPRETPQNPLESAVFLGIGLFLGYLLSSYFTRKKIRI